ncbi:MAG: hypothetical protein QOK40_1635 [Miltoncostaeaceae bacterium]|jgi:uncharacterized integral membrane protein|nr:hypothetical protein [Miltoncostaeaceae bacterium]
MVDQPTEPTQIQEPPRQGLDPRQVRQLLLVAVLVLVAVVILAFVIQNRRRTTVSFVFFDTNASLIWVILLSVVAGIIVGLVVPPIIRKRRTRA